MLEVVTKKIDAQGRLVLPREWGVSALKETDEVVLLIFDDHIRIVPRNIDLSRYIDSVEVDGKTLPTIMNSDANSGLNARAAN